MINYFLAPKKTAHLLKIILNYLIYYNMQKLIITKKANDSCENYKRLMSGKKNIILDNIIAHDLAKNSKIKLEQNLNILPDLKKRIDQMDNTKSTLGIKEDELINQLNNMNYTLKHLKNTNECLKTEIVTYSEAQHLIE